MMLSSVIYNVEIICLSTRLIIYLMVGSISNAQKGQNTIKGVTKDVECQIRS